MLLLIPVLAGCTESASAEPPARFPPAAPATDAPAPSRSAGHSPIRWTGLAGRCPELTSDAAHELAVAGMGRPTRDHHTRRPALLVADCAWGSADRPRVAVRITIAGSEAAATAQWQVLSAGQERRIPAAGPDAFSAVEVPALVIRVRSHNAVAIVRLVVPENEATEGRFEDLRPAAAAITRDVLDDLR
ncbi:MAG TPA: hypothetical protein VFH03_17740 [Actinoplanes sp.]|nr:hypothetical protein [Actinoplanes sp.]